MNKYTAMAKCIVQFLPVNKTICLKVWISVHVHDAIELFLTRPFLFLFKRPRQCDSEPAGTMPGP